MSLLVPLVIVVVALAASVIATRVRSRPESPLIDEHGYRVAAWRY